jgi:hypothetical protein
MEDINPNILLKAVDLFRKRAFGINSLEDYVTIVNYVALFSFGGIETVIKFFKY